MQSGMFNGNTVCVVIEDEEDKKRCRKCRCWRALELYRGEMLHVIFAWGIRKNGQRKMRRRLGK